MMVVSSKLFINVGQRLVDCGCVKAYSVRWRCGRVVEGAPLLRDLHNVRPNFLKQLWTTYSTTTHPVGVLSKTFLKGWTEKWTEKAG